MANDDDRARIRELEQKVAFLTGQVENLTGLITSISKEMQNGFTRVSNDFATQLNKVLENGHAGTGEKRTSNDKESE